MSPDRQIDWLDAERDRLLAENAKLREALKPFAEYAQAVSPGWGDDTGTSLLFRQPDGSMEHNPRITLGDCRRALEARPCAE